MINIYIYRIIHIYIYIELYIYIYIYIYIYYVYIYIFVYVWSPPPAPPKLRIRSLTIYKLRTRSLTIYKYIRNNNKSLSLHLQNSCLPHLLERPHLTLPATSGVETENHFTRRLQHMCAKKNVVQWIGVCCVLYTYIYIHMYMYLCILYI